MGRQHYRGDLLLIGSLQQLIAFNSHDIQDCHIKIFSFQVILGCFEIRRFNGITHRQQVFQGRPVGQPLLELRGLFRQLRVRQRLVAGLELPDQGGGRLLH